MTITVSVHELKTLMSEALKRKEYHQYDIAFLVDMYLEGELRGHSSHGLAAFPGFLKLDYRDLPQPEVLLESDAFYALDAKGHGQAMIRHVADEVCQRAKSQVIGAASIRNMDIWLRPGYVASYIAKKGFIGIVVNDGAGEAVAPPGGYDPTVGTNPLAYAIPTEDGPLEVDMATSKRAWGQVRLAKKLGTDLPVETFYTSDGEVAVDPAEAYSVKSFGDYKGFALGFLIETLCRSLTGMGMLLESSGVGGDYEKKFPEIGAFLLAVDPQDLVGLDRFKEENSRAIKKIEASAALPGNSVRLPGAGGGKKMVGCLAKDEVEVPEQVWQDLQALTVE